MQPKVSRTETATARSKQWLAINSRIWDVLDSHDQNPHDESKWTIDIAGLDAIVAVVEELLERRSGEKATAPISEALEWRECLREWFDNEERAVYSPEFLDSLAEHCAAFDHGRRSGEVPPALFNDEAERLNSDSGNERKVEQRSNEAISPHPNVVGSPPVFQGGAHWVQRRTAEAQPARTRCTGCGHFDNELTYDLGPCSTYGTDGHHLVPVDARGIAIPRSDLAKIEQLEDSVFALSTVLRDIRRHGLTVALRNEIDILLPEDS